MITQLSGTAVPGAVTQFVQVVIFLTPELRYFTKEI